MRKGCNYEGLEKGIRISLQAAMNYYDVDPTNNFLREILDRIVKDIREGKPAYQQQ